MITSWDIIKISEDYVKGKNFRGGYVEVYVNPTRAEMKRVASKNVIRFTADAKTAPPTVYVWDASKAIHYEVLTLIGTDKIDTQPWILGGIAELSGSGAVMTGWDNFHHVMQNMDTSLRQNAIDFLTRLFNYNWKWLDKYFLATPYIENRQQEFKTRAEKPFVKSKFW